MNGSTVFQGTDLVKHKIVTVDAKPVRKSPYRVPFSLRREMEDKILSMLNKGVIEESTYQSQLYYCQKNLRIESLNIDFALIFAH